MSDSAQDPPINAVEFIRGVEDCRAGNPRLTNASESYNAGYSARENIDQVKGGAR